MEIEKRWKIWSDVTWAKLEFGQKSFLFLK